ncbi:MAG TPA: S9 family peptidase [Haliangiales bacterium]|nr:S9 family peptidase [Haliangiales bacterium]
MRILVAALVVLSVRPALAADTHPFGVRDMQSMDRVGAPIVSPDGKSSVFTVTATDLDANVRRSSLWTVKVDGTGLRRLTNPDRGNDDNPVWSPDGASIWFVSTRGGSSQVWRIPADGGEAERVTDEPLDVRNLSVSPDGRLLAYTMGVFPDCDTPACTRKRADERAARKATGRVYDSLMVRHWDAWADGTRSHLFVRGTARTAASIDVTRGMNADTPSQPFGGPDEIAFAPDSRSLVFSAKLLARASEEAWSTNFDLFQVPVDGSARPRSLTADNPATDTRPAFSPDGRTLAYLAMRRPGYEADRLHVMVMSWPPAGKPREVAAAWDRSPDHLSFSRDGKSLLVTADSLGHAGLFRIDVASGKVVELVGRGTARGPADAGNAIVFAHESLRAPADLWALAGTTMRRLTSFNADRLAAARMGETEEMTFPGAGGDTVHAWIVKPVDFAPGRTYPVAFLVHGGPQGSWHDDFHYRWNPQVFAGAGYAVIAVDFHGSTGYGQAFVDAINDDWGGKPLIDLQKGLAAATTKHAWMDADRVAALGASYGGWMVNWIAGNWPDRFRCLVSHDGNIDERAAYFETEELWFPEWEHKGTPWDNPAGYAKASPADHIAKWKTPMLIVHGGRDYRVVDVQGLGAFNALQRKGIPSKLLYFPDENHWVLKPQNSVLWYDTVIAWLDQWTKPAR